jgi:uncharacterized repeat protein (TIGR03803 family)
MTNIHFHNHRRSHTLSLLALAAIVLGTTVLTTAQTETAIAYTPHSDSGLVFDAAGNLYGTTDNGGNLNCADGSGNGCGTVSELSPASGGGWTQTVLYSFNGGTDGEFPWSSLVFERAGNLYGTTVAGGGSSNCIRGCGTIFKLSHTSAGWTEHVLHVFTGNDGSAPISALIFDAHGDLYGTTSTSTGCASGVSCGTIYRFSLNSVPHFAVLNIFTGGASGSSPLGPLARDSAGNLYGVTAGGGNTGSNCGPNGCGVVFKLTPASGVWPETVLHTFVGTDGSSLNGGLIFDRYHRRLYGTANGGGSHNWGELFELSIATGKLIVPYSFTGDGNVDGGDPNSGVVFDAAGNLYGSAVGGFNNNCDFAGPCGSVFKLSPSSGGWQISATYPTPNA